MNSNTSPDFPGMRKVEAFSGLLPRGKDWLSPQDAAVVLGQSPTHVRAMCDRGWIPCHSVPTDRGRRVRIRREAMQIYLAKTANYGSADIADVILEALTLLDSHDLREVVNAANRQIRTLRRSA